MSAFSLSLALPSASVAEPDASPDWEALAKERAEARWRALIEGRLESAYAFLSPAQREITSFDAYRRKIGGVGTWKDVDVQNATCDESRCKTATSVFFEFRHRRLPEPVKSSELLEETWLIDEAGGQLWFVPNK
ncbi:MAG: hypothetical protein U9Q81_06000 [Pseudomonadota bacterium]|nr:hypothetical protein [Pseudomonadota bacterium]